MISKYLKAPPFTHIEVIVQYQLIMLGFLAVLVLGLLVYRNWNAIRIAKLKEQFADSLISEMLQFLESGENTPKVTAIPIPKWYQFQNRRVLKTVFLEHFNSVSGSEKDYLAGRYKDLRFTAEDYDAAHSWVWWRRLQTVSNLSLIGQDEFAPLLFRLTRDRHGLVSATAYLALSNLQSEYNKAELVTDLPLSILARKNLLFEILRNWARIYGSNVVINQIRTVKDPILLSTLVLAVSALQTTEVGDAYASILKDRIELPPEAIQEMLSLFRKVGDPSWLDTARPYLFHSQEVIRLRALEYLVTMGEYELLDIPAVRNDHSVIIQRYVKLQDELMNGVQDEKQGAA